MRRYQILRNEWEKLVWDPKPEPKPKSRNPLFVAEETEKYVWRDPRRDAYKMNNQPLGRLVILNSNDVKVIKCGTLI